MTVPCSLSSLRFSGLLNFTSSACCCGKGFEGGLHILRGGFVAVGQHVLQARHAQLGQAGVELGDVAHPVAAVNQTAQAGPAGQGEDAGQCQNQAEAQAQFQVHADVAEPAIHENSSSNAVLLDRRWLEDCCWGASKLCKQGVSAAIPGAETFFAMAFTRKCCTLCRG
jgi:hypothetical protein